MLDRSFGFMGHARDHIDFAGRADTKRLNLVFAGDPLSVRTALTGTMDALSAMNPGRQTLGVAQIVLGEVLNNIVEHAYSADRGVIEIEVDREDKALSFRITDDGRPMPGDALPPGRAHDLDVPADALPEGGFGWLLIRELTEGLSYRRDASRNTLSFRIPVTSPETAH